VLVTVVNVGEMWVRVCHWRVVMSMRVWSRISDRRIARVMLVLMVFVVYVRMLMVHALVMMLVLVVLRQVKPNAHTHQNCGD